jgi:hypothetical protein
MSNAARMLPIVTEVDVATEHRKAEGTRGPSSMPAMNTRGASHLAKPRPPDHRPKLFLDQVGLIPPSKVDLIDTEIVGLCSEFLGAGTDPANTALWIMLALTDATEPEDTENSKGNLMLQRHYRRWRERTGESSAQGRVSHLLFLVCS